jgi:hypothetical protein
VAISSPLNPSSIVRDRSTTAEAAQNFISGGTPLGSSVVSSAANKIVGFYRGAAGVAPQVPDLGSIIQTLSSNILNNVETRVQSINQNVNQIVGSRLNKLEKSYNDRVNKIDTNTPNRILEKFLSLYDKAIGYINFFANPSNVKKLGENLESLQKVFAETFEVAKNIRKTIVRVVNQLSNLPTASAGGSDLNLDVKVPGGGLRRSAPTGIMRAMRRRPGLMLGGAALAGAGGSQVVSALAQPGRGNVEAISTGGEGVPTPLLERFSLILDRFDSVLKGLKPREQQSKPSAGSSGTATPSEQKEPGGPGGGGGGPVSTEALKGNTNAEKVYNALLSEGFTPEAASGVIGNLMQESSVNPTQKQIGGGPGRGIAQWGTGKGSGERWDRLVDWARKSGKDPMKLETQYEWMILEMRQRGTLRRLKDVKNVKQATDLFEEEMLAAGIPHMSRRYKFAEMAYKEFGKGTQANIKGRQQPIPTQQTTQEITQKNNIKAQVNQVTASQVSAAPQQSQVQQQVAQQVSQPILIAPPPQVNIVPMSGRMNQKSGQQKPQLPPEKISGGGQVPFLMSTNNDNFLTLYSKMVYNIVDG